MTDDNSTLIPLSSNPIQNPAILSRVIEEGEMVLVNGDSAASLALTNQTAVLIWNLVDGRNSVQDIIDEIKNQFQQVPDTVEDDILILLQKLSEKGFIGFEWKQDSSL